MRAKNCTAQALVVDGGRILGAGQFGEVNSRDPAVAAHLDAGRLRRPSRRPTPATNDPDPALDTAATSDVEPGDEA